MNTLPTAPLTPQPGKKGVALISVLAVIVLVTALVIGFLIRAGYEGASSTNFRAVSTTRLLADTTVNLVQAEINEAISWQESSGFHAWASQPGAIRVFDQNGNLTRFYRLYSAQSLASNMTSNSALALLSNDLPPVDWASQPSLWVDLNAPVKVTGVTGTNGLKAPDYLVFPIVDPRDPANPGTIDSPSTNLTSSGTTGMPGFSIANPPGKTTQQPIPMPVRWLYVLENGKIVAPTVSGSTINIEGATSNNPIIGRIAFWTDDETSKVNVNTACGSLSIRSGTTLPAPWETPRFRILDEYRLFSQNQPVHGEYQRYPGHPATTDIYSVFQALGVSTAGYPYPYPSYATTGAQLPQAISTGMFKLLPRYAESFSSLGGSIYTTSASVQGSLTAINNGEPKIDRLYTSIGEMLYTPQRDSSGLTRQQIESGKFFLTAHSRAPEETLFGTPRITIWPIDSAYGSNPTATNSTKLASVFDKTIAFCSTTGSGAYSLAYYFQRHDSTSPTNDYDNIQRNKDLYAYMQNLTSQNIPGYGGKLSVKYAANGENDQILTEILDYVRCTNLWDHSIKDADPTKPGPRFTPAYGTPANGQGQVVPLQIGSSRGLGRMYTLSEIGLLIICTADGNGLQPSQTNSLSDWRSVSNLASTTTQLKDSSGIPQSVVINNNTYVNPTLADNYGGTRMALSSGQKRLQAMLLFEVSSPMLGYDAIMPDFNINITGLTNLLIDGQHPFPSSANGTTASMGVRINATQSTGGLNGIQYFISKMDWSNNNNRINGWNSSLSGNPYLFVSNPFTVGTASDGSGTIDIGGGTFTVAIQVKSLTANQQNGNSAPNGPLRTVQTFNINFPAVSVPIPDLMQYGIKSSGTSTATFYPSDWWGFDYRIKQVGSNYASTMGSYSPGPQLSPGCVIRVDPATPAGTWTTTTSSAAISVPFYKNTNGSYGSTPPSDVVRTLIPFKGDIRLLMAKSVVNADGSSDMVTPPGYTDSTRKLVNNFMQNMDSNAVPGSDLSGKLVAGANYSAKYAPKVPSDLVPQQNMDWDNGGPLARDGAYANKPDEGNIYTNSGAPYYNGENQYNAINNLASYFTPNRIMPSAVMFGSLPTGVKENIPWRTLLFRPYPSTLNPNHYGNTNPKDYLYLDLFNMPVVEPYAISEPFSTSGKINLNYQIVPFTYITRSTALQAVLRSELIPRMPLGSESAKSSTTTEAYNKGIPNLSDTFPGNPKPARLPINLSDSDGTLAQFKAKFDSGDIFKSAAEICDIYLVPQGYTWPSFVTQWYGNDFAMVGDNGRERSYAAIYPRLTTKSNTFTVYFTIQSLRNPNNAPAIWDETRGNITGEYRGSTTIERYINPTQNIMDYATASPSSWKPLDTYYQWRVIANNSFAP